MIDYFAASYLGDDRWFVEGILIADDMSAITIQFGGCVTGTTTPGEGGYFSVIATSPGTNTVTADASDGTNTAHAEVILTGPAPVAI